MRKVELSLKEKYKYETIKKLVETNGYKERTRVKLKLKRFYQLGGKARQNAIDNYRCWVENYEAPVEEIEEYYEMCDGEGGPGYFDKDGNLVEDF